MNDFYMQSEINERERSIRARRPTPKPEERGRPLITALFAALKQAVGESLHRRRGKFVTGRGVAPSPSEAEMP
jgi:hypothetical protein